MLETYFESRFTLNHLRNGPSGPCLDGFVRARQEDGYSPWTARHHLRGAHHFGHVLKRTRVALAAVQPDSIDAFRRHVQHCHCPKPRGGATEDTVRGATCVLGHLGHAGVVTRPVHHPWPALVQGFRTWLKNHRGASDTTRSRYSTAAVELLSELGGDPGQYDAARLRPFLLARARRRGGGGTKAISSNRSSVGWDRSHRAPPCRNASLWLGHSSTQTTEVYTRVDPAEKLEAINMLAPPKIRPGRFRPPDKLLDMLKGQSLWGAKSHNPLDCAGSQHAHSP